MLKLSYSAGESLGQEDKHTVWMNTPCTKMPGSDAHCGLLSQGRNHAGEESWPGPCEWIESGQGSAPKTKAQEHLSPSRLWSTWWALLGLDILSFAMYLWAQVSARITARRNWMTLPPEAEIHCVIYSSNISWAYTKLGVTWEKTNSSP